MDPEKKKLFQFERRRFECNSIIIPSVIATNHNNVRLCVSARESCLQPTLYYYYYYYYDGRKTIRLINGNTVGANRFWYERSGFGGDGLDLNFLVVRARILRYCAFVFRPRRQSYPTPPALCLSYNT